MAFVWDLIQQLQLRSTRSKAKSAASRARTAEVRAKVAESRSKSAEARARSLDARVEISRAAAAKAARRVIPQTTDPRALSRPFVIVTAAIHTSDELAIRALDVQAQVARFDRSVAELGVVVRQIRFRLATVMRAVDGTINELDGDLRTAVDGRARAMVADVRRAPARATLVLGDLHAGDLALRTAESRLATISTGVDDWRDGARRAITSSRRTLSELYGDMLLVQNVISSVVPYSSSPRPSDPMTSSASSQMSSTL